MPTRILSSALVGLEARTIEVEADVSPGLPNFIIVGLPDAAVQESKERVRSAIKNSGLSFPQTRVTINLAPADLKKAGPVYDLPIAMAILRSDGTVPTVESTRQMFIGELALNGRVRPVKGILPIALTAQDDCDELFVPKDNLAEAAAALDPKHGQLKIFPVRHLTELVSHMRGEKSLVSLVVELPRPRRTSVPNPDFRDIRGQEAAKRALEIAAAGAHNVLLDGPPGSGKTMLAQALPSILPDLQRSEMLEVTKIHSVAGLIRPGDGLMGHRPFRAPHHSASPVSLIGGGSWPKPGEVSLAHRGVLFLDEFPEFQRHVLENLRQPLEEGSVLVSRVNSTLSFPARFILIAASNPCPCGHLDDLRHDCTCRPSQVQRYRQKISGPLLDRIDLRIDVPAVPIERIMDPEQSEDSATVRSRVMLARNRQAVRFRDTDIMTNAEMPGRDLETYCQMQESARRMLKRAGERLGLSARSYSRLLKVARTIADLEDDARVGEGHLSEAVRYRGRK